jgi:hypothetical protein
MAEGGQKDDAALMDIRHERRALWTPAFAGVTSVA